MTEYRITGMHIENFKGIKDIELDFDKDTTHICGRNGSGKSSLVDAFCWVLFNTDSKGNAPGSDNFREKPLDDNGAEIHYLDTMVEIRGTLNGLPYNLKRLQRENWAQKRGFIENIYTGNESTYYVNSVETKRTDFQKRIAEIAPTDILKVLGTLGEFNRRNWKERRTTLLAMCDVDVDAVLLGNDKYRAIADEVHETGVDVDGQRKLVADRIKALNSDLRLCPIRIDEATKALPPDVDGRKLKDARYMIDDAQQDIENIDKFIANLRAKQSADDVHVRIADLEREAADIKKRMQDELAKKRADAENEIQSLGIAEQRQFVYKQDIENRLRLAKMDLQNYTEQREDLLRLFDKVAAQRAEVKTVCETCGQPLTEEISERLKIEAEAKRKADKDEIRAKGSVIRAQMDEAQKRVNELEAELSKAVVEFAQRTEAVKNAAAIKAGLPTVPMYGDEPRLAEIAQEIASLNTDGVATIDTEIAGLNRRRAELQEIINRNQAVVVRYEASEETQKRIAELKAEQVRIGKEVAAQEKLQALIEQFIRDRCDLLTDSINNLFPTVRWKLFNTQINGGITDVCTCLIPCESGLIAYESANTAAQICADIEIIKALSDKYGVKVPLFIDNAERVNNLPDAGTQTITLSVTTDAGLKIN